MGAQDPGAGGDPVAHQRRLVADLCKMLDPNRTRPGDHDQGQNGNGSTHAPRPSESSAPSNGNGNRNGHALPLPVEGLSPRMHQTLQRLLAGDSEKQIALRLCRRSRTWKWHKEPKRRNTFAQPIRMAELRSPFGRWPAPTF